MAIEKKGHGLENSKEIFEGAYKLSMMRHSKMTPEEQAIRADERKRVASSVEHMFEGTTQTGNGEIVETRNNWSIIFARAIRKMKNKD